MGNPLFATKPLSLLLEEARGENRLRRVLGPAQLTSLGNLSRWAFLFTFAGVGLRTDFREMKRQGFRPFIVGALAELTVTVVTLGLVYGASAVFGL